jgi:hypothetical protein
MHHRFLFAGIGLVCACTWMLFFQVPIPSPVLMVLWLLGLGFWLFGYGSILITPSADTTLHSRLIIPALLLAALMPPVLSKDVFIYLLQGKLAWQGVLTYTNGTLNNLHPWVEYTDPQWHDCPNHYGFLPMVLFTAVTFKTNLGLALLLLKLIFLLLAWLCYQFVQRLALLVTPDVTKAQQAILAFGLNPVFLLQGLGQMHIDLLACVFVLLFILGLIGKHWWLAPLAIACLGAIKFLLFPVFLGLYVVYQIYQWHRSRLDVRLAASGIALATVLVGLSYLPIWEGTATITYPMAYHNLKEPVKSVTELAAYLVAFIQPNPVADRSTTADPFLQGKIAAGQWLSPIFKCMAVLFAFWLVWRDTKLKATRPIILTLGALILLVFILYAPVMHAWYFLLVLPFFVWYTDHRFIWLYLVITFGLCNTYELGAHLQKPFGNALTIVGTILSVLSYFIGFRHLYLKPSPHVD